MTSLRRSATFKEKQIITNTPDSDRLDAERVRGIRKSTMKVSPLYAVNYSRFVVDHIRLTTAKPFDQVRDRKSVV